MTEEMQAGAVTPPPPTEAAPQVVSPEIEAANAAALAADRAEFIRTSDPLDTSADYSKPGTVDFQNGKF